MTALKHEGRRGKQEINTKFDRKIRREGTPLEYRLRLENNIKGI
jgi:hypothetical protein